MQMNKYRVYSDKEIEVLLNTSGVEKIKNKSQIVYTNNFKLWAVKNKLSNPEKTARQIFTEGGFDVNILDERTPQKRLSSWIKKYEKYGDNYFKNNKSFYQTQEDSNVVILLIDPHLK